MKIEDMKLIITDPAPPARDQYGNFKVTGIRQNRHYRIEDGAGNSILIPDLAARMGRKPTSVYQMLKRFEAGTHDLRFRELIVKSMCRTYVPRRRGPAALIAASGLADALENVLTWTKCAEGCAQTRYEIIMSKQRRELDDFEIRHKAWREEEPARRELRNAQGLDSVPYVPMPRRPQFERIQKPLCTCGRVAAESAVREELGKCEVLP